MSQQTIKFMDVQQAVDTTYTLRARSNTDGTRQIVGLATDYRAECRFVRSDGSVVGTLRSIDSDIIIVPEGTGEEERIVIKFFGENTETWEFPDWPLKDDRITYTGTEPAFPTQELYGTLLLRDPSGIDARYYSGARLPVMFEASSTLTVTEPSDGVGGL